MSRGAWPPSSARVNQLKIGLATSTVYVIGASYEKPWNRFNFNVIWQFYDNFPQKT
jgi:hypothetical protein